MTPRLLLQSPKFTAVGATMGNGRTALHLAAGGGHEAVCRLLLESPEFDERRAALVDLLSELLEQAMPEHEALRAAKAEAVAAFDAVRPHALALWLYNRDARGGHRPSALAWRPRAPRQ